MSIFIPAFHGRSQRNDEAWGDLLISMATIYCKKAFIVWCGLCFRVIYLLSPLSYYHICSGSRISPHLFSPHALWSSLSFFFFFFFPSHARFLSWISPRRPPTPLPGADWAVFSSLNQWACCCRVILYKPTPRSWDTVFGMPFVSPPLWGPLPWDWKKFSVGFVRFKGVSPFLSPPPLFTGSCWEMQIYWHPPQSITAVWHPLLKHMLYYWTCIWLD